MHEIVFFDKEKIVIKQIKNLPREIDCCELRREGQAIPESMDPESMQTPFSREWVMITSSMVKEFKVAWHEKKSIVAVRISRELPWMYVGITKKIILINALAECFIARVKKSIRCGECNGRGVKYFREDGKMEKRLCTECVDGIKVEFIKYFNQAGKVV